MKKQIHKKDLIELKIEDLAFGARGVARQNDFVWFVDRSIPGQKVIARVIKIKQNFGEAIVEEIVQYSPHQVEPHCRYFGICGGCQLQHLDYKVQIEQKSKQVREILERIGGFRDPTVRPTLPSQQIYGYRNKMEFTFSDRRWITQDTPLAQSDNFALGLHIPKRFDKVLDIENCPLQSDKCNKVYEAIKNLTQKTELKPYNNKTHIGFWRFFIIREGKNTGDLMVNLITTSQALDKGKQALNWIVHKLFWNYPEVKTVVHSMSDRIGQVAIGETEHLLLGMGKIKEMVGGKIFEISPTAFFQTNTHQAERLLDAIAELADFRNTETVYDLYCGTGAIGISIADKVQQVVGIEVAESAIEDAKTNAALNSLSNIQFILADMKDALMGKENLFQEYGPPDVVILDPPRGGTHPKTIDGILNLSSLKIVYVSCNPPIMARDLKIFCENTYTLQIVQPIDMFPHTRHIEVVALLTRKDK